MPFEKGHPKFGGRKKGSGNRKTFADLLKEHEFDPVKELITLVKSDKLSDRDKAWLIADMIQYVYPKLRSRDDDSDDDVDPKQDRIYESQWTK